MQVAFEGQSPEEGAGPVVGGLESSGRSSCSLSGLSFCSA